MKKVILFLAVFCLICVPAFALLDDHSTNIGQQQGFVSDIENDIETDIENRNSLENDIENDIENRNTNTNLLGNDLDSRIDNEVDNEIDNEIDIENEQDQGQAQGQVAVGKVAVDIQDNSEYKSYSFSPPAIHAQKGTESGNMYSIFGGVGLSQTEEYTVAIETLATIERMQGAGYLTVEEAKEEALKVYTQMRTATQPKRWLGIFGKTRGRHLLNVFGLLAWDSWYAEGQEPFSKSGDWGSGEEKVKEVSEPDVNDGSGNEGYVN